MFSLDIVDSDLFLDMSKTAQLLYFNLGMRADDDGFIQNPKRLLRMLGTDEDDLKLLIAKGFVIHFETGVIVMTHWRQNNYIQKDRYKETLHKAEKHLLNVDENGTYSLKQFECIQDVYNPVYNLDTQVRLGKDRLGKDRLGKDNNMSDKSDDVIPYSEIISYLNEKTGRGFRNVDANKKLIKARWNEGFKVEDFKTVIDNMVTNWSGKVFNGVPAENYLQPKTLFSNKFDNYLNQKPVTRPQDISLYEDEERPF